MTSVFCDILEQLENPWTLAEILWTLAVLMALVSSDMMWAMIHPIRACDRAVRQGCDRTGLAGKNWYLYLTGQNSSPRKTPPVWSNYSVLSLLPPPFGDENT